MPWREPDKPVPAGAAPEPPVGPFHDADVDAARAGNCLVVAGPWRLRLPSVFGFCGGVNAALDQLMTVFEKVEPQRVWMLGEIIHNDTVNSCFADAGVNILPDNDLDRVFRAAKPGDAVVIPAFGIPRQLHEKLERCLEPECRLVDTTCACVKASWRFVARMAAAGRTVVLHGKPEHPEVLATLSRGLTPGNALIIVPDLDAAGRLAAVLQGAPVGSLPVDLVWQADKLDLDHLALANQTTMLCSETHRIEQILSTALRSRPGTEIVTVNTVCRATETRQRAATDLCERPFDLALVIGGYASSNTNQLYRLAARKATTYFVRDARALRSRRITHYVPETHELKVTEDWISAEPCEIVLLAGASCPAADIGGVIRRLRQIAQELASPPTQATRHPAGSGGAKHGNG